ncbi:SpoIIE family protein phosphatase [Planctellipticum variicoloris]|uniref:SpoIIE family protein phosphatase n=1 Tax=Planctellipticum variicoloris TaxID=3064265 RepID=UPI0030139F9F|nr:SpoIIE family protein phosphatase [Planctomycetaceae bacterium SH412]
MANLQVISGGPAGVWELRGERTILGRHSGCEIVLDDGAISRRHAQILESHGNYFLEDLRSRNGTELNGQPVRGRTELRDGDEIQICDFRLRFDVHGKRAARSRASGRNATAVRDPGTTGNRPVVRLAEREPVPEDHGSSILSTFEAGGERSEARLSVRPETKLRAILEISRQLGSVLELDDVLPVLLKTLLKLFPQADSGFVLLRSAESDELEQRASIARYEGDDEVVPVSRTIVREAIQTGRAILSADARDDERFAASQSIASLRIRTVMCAPLLDANSAAIGVIQLSSRDLGRAFTAEDLDLLASVSWQAALAVENARLHEDLLKQRDLDRDLEFATQVQLGFLPHQPPALPGYEFADYYEPANRVGGDYFDYVQLPDGRVAVAVGDVAGKGVPAALLMARLHAAGRYHLLSASSAASALTNLNAEIASSGLGYRFITLALAIVDAERHEVTLANAGHLPPVFRHVDGSIEQPGIKESGMPLGILPDQQFQEIRLSLDAGDTLVFYTDGVTEAMDAENRIYGRVRLGETVGLGPPRVTDLVPAIVEDVEAFGGAHQQRDDLCIVAIRRVLPGEPVSQPRAAAR